MFTLLPDVTGSRLKRSHIRRVMVFKEIIIIVLLYCKYCYKLQLAWIKTVDIITKNLENNSKKYGMHG